MVSSKQGYGFIKMGLWFQDHTVLIQTGSWFQDHTGFIKEHYGFKITPVSLKSTMVSRSYWFNLNMIIVSSKKGYGFI